jgi:uncharacterized protein
MIIDCDVHPQLKRAENLADYMPGRYREHFMKWRGNSPKGLTNYEVPQGGRRLDSIPADGNPSGSDPDLFKKQLLDEAGVDIAIHLCNVGGNSRDPEIDAALKSGMNEWMAKTWIGEYNSHGRYRAAIGIALDNPSAAVSEIEKWADHPNFVQVLGNPETGVPLGNPRFDPIWEAAARHRLPVALHMGTSGLPAMQTPVGYCAYYLEIHSVAFAAVHATHLLSFICEGAFDRHPDLKVVLVEGGFSWVGPLIWRLEKSWETVRAAFPTLKRRPSEYLYDHIRLTSQPIEEPARPGDLSRLYDMIDAPRILMFSTDYPHWDFDNPKRALPRMSPEALDRIRFRNAAELYNIAVD